METSKILHLLPSLFSFIVQLILWCRQALANALAAAPSMWTLGNAGMGALQVLQFYLKIANSIFLMD